MRRVLLGVEPEPAVVGAFTALQNRDGGFPCGMVQGNLSAVHKTLNALWWLDELGMLSSPTADKAFAYLFKVQSDDGGWDEDPAITQYELPPWIRPGDLGTRLYLSSYAAHWSAAKGYETHSAFREALRFLLKHRDETGKFYGFLHSTWIATSVFLMAGQEYAEVVEEGLQVLMEVPLSEWPAGDICWALNYLGRAGLPKAHPFVEKGLVELMGRQGSDGGWKDVGDEADAVTTMQVLKAFKHYGLVRFTG